MESPQFDLEVGKSKNGEGCLAGDLQSRRIEPALVELICID